MRIASRGNLTVQLIRMQRFEVGYQQRVDQHRPCLGKPQLQPQHEPNHEQANCRLDRVELSRESRSSDPWAVAVGRADTVRLSTAATDDALPAVAPTSPKPKPITPVAGSPALSGLGVSLIVPGTLLDVVA